MIQLEINQISRAGSDCTAPYEVIIHGKCTVRDFVECVLTRNKEWGYIGIADGSILGSPRIEYARGVVTVESDLFEKIENYIVVKASASGGWSRMDFLLTIEESEDKRGQVMTREEAISWLIKPTVTSTEVSPTKAKELEAYNMAIEALSQVRCNDCKWNDDVIEVVRCKDCVWWAINNTGICLNHLMDTEENDFCSWAKMKGGTE